MGLRLFHGSIRKKLIFLVLLATIPAFLLNFITELENRKRAVQTAKNDTAIYLNGFCQIQQRITDSTRSLLKTVAAIPEIKKMNSRGADRILSSLLEANPIYTNVILVDLNGDPIAAGKGIENVKKLNFSDRRQFRDALASGEFSAGEFVVGKHTKKSIFPFGIPVKGEDGKYVGAIIIGVNLQHYVKVFDESDFPEGSFFGICDSSGIRIFRYPSPGDIAPGMPIKKKVFEHARSSDGVGLMEIVDSTGVKRIIASTPLRLRPDDSPYIYMFMGQDAAVVLHNADFIITRVSITTVVSLTMALLIAWFAGGRGIADNLERLAKVARDMGQTGRASGSGIDYTDGEVGSLARTWDSMVGQLRKHEDDRNEALQLLSESEERHRIILEHNPGGICLIDPYSQKIIFANASFIELFEVPDGHLDSLNIMNLHPQRDSGFIEEEIAKHLTEGGGDFHDISCQTTNGKNLVVDIRTVVLTIKGQTFLAGFFIDMTENKKIQTDLLAAKEEAERANSAKDDFLANISHEVRTPLNGVIGMLQLMKGTELNREQAEYIATGLKSSNSLRRVLDDLLDFSKIEAGILDIWEEPFELDELLGQCADLLSVQADEKGLALEWSISPGTENVFMGDAGRLRQILFNLLGNAIKFTDEGVISIDAFTLPHRDEKQLRLFFSVTDTGVGIPDDKISKIFDSFTQVDGSRTRRFQGVGLGLSIVRRLVNLMDGSLTIESELGKGTTVQFYVLVGRDIPDNREVRQKEDVHTHERKLKLLLVEDEKVNMFMARRLLEKMGHKVDCAENGRECLKIVSEGTYDAVLMDIQMPVMTGLEATRLIRNSSEFSKVSAIPIIALTAHAARVDMLEAFDAGMDEYVTKPFEGAELEAVLFRVTGL